MGCLLGEDDGALEGDAEGGCVGVCVGVFEGGAVGCVINEMERVYESNKFVETTRKTSKECNKCLNVNTFLPKE